MCLRMCAALQRVQAQLHVRWKEGENMRGRDRMCNRRALRVVSRSTSIHAEEKGAVD
jgi:hypothetical protein